MGRKPYGVVGYRFVEFNVIQSISATVDVVGTCQSTVGAPVNCYRPIVIEVLPVML